VVGGEQLDTVEAASLCPQRCVDVRLDRRLDLDDAHAVAAVGVVVARQARRRPRRVETVVEVAVLPDVVQLLHDGCAFGVDRIGDRSEAGDHRVVARAEVATCQHGGRVHRHGLDDDQRRAPAGAFDVVAEVLAAGEPELAHVGGVCAEHDAVAQREVSQLQRFGEVRERCVHRAPVVVTVRR
jgi:hypothetical protein